MGVISFRLSDEAARKLKARGISPGARAKELLEAEVRRLDADELMTWFEAHAVKLDRPVAELVREIRDEH